MPPPATSDPVDWYPARLLRERPPTDEGDESAIKEQSKFALIILNQPLRDVPTLKKLWENSSWRLAADGGANRLLDILIGPEGNEGTGAAVESEMYTPSKKLDIIIGDLDSLSDRAKQYFTNPKTITTTANNNNNNNKTIIIKDPDQESTDFGKAVTYIRSKNDAISSHAPTDIVALGGLGGRVDQGLSQLHHLYLFQKEDGQEYKQGRMFLVSESSLTFVLKGGERKHRIHVRDDEGSNDQDGGDLFDKYVGIIPIKEPSVITTSGLEWDVKDWETEFGGRMSTSNHVLPETKVVEVQTAKDVLFTIALKQD